MENFGHAHSVVRHEIPPAAQASMRSKHKLHKPASKQVNEILQIACSGGCAAELLTTLPALAARLRKTTAPCSVNGEGKKVLPCGLMIT